MKAIDLVKRIHRRVNGNIKYPAWGSDKCTLYIETANDVITALCTDPENKWDWCWEEREFGAIAEAQLTYDLDDDVFDLSDKVYVTTETQTFVFNVIKPADRKKFTNSVYISSDSPKQITFTNMPPEAVGGTITAGVYVIPPLITSPNQNVPVQRPLYVAFETAAQLVLTIPAKQDMYDDLHDLAVDEYDKMAMVNDNVPAGNSDTVPYGDFGNAAGGL